MPKFQEEGGCSFIWPQPTLMNSYRVLGTVPSTRGRKIRTGLYLHGIQSVLGKQTSKELQHKARMLRDLVWRQRTGEGGNPHRDKALGYRRLGTRICQNPANIHLKFVFFIINFTFKDLNKY